MDPDTLFRVGNAVALLGWLALLASPWFPAMFLLDFSVEEIGPCFCNRALLDAQAVLEERMDGLREALEKPVDLGR